MCRLYRLNIDTVTEYCVPWLNIQRMRIAIPQFGCSVKQLEHASKNLAEGSKKQLVQ